MTATADAADIIHCHTWYTYMAGCLLKQILAAPLVVTTHSLEPHRPWKKDQLGDSYHATCWLEKTAMENADGIIAVSETMKQNVMDLYQIPPEKIQVIYNGVDTRFFCETSRPETLRTYGIDPDKPYILFVGRITRQKGIMHLIRAIAMVDPGVQAVLCASAPDTGEIAQEMETRVEKAPGRQQAERFSGFQKQSLCRICRSFTAMPLFLYALLCMNLSASSTLRRVRAVHRWWRQRSGVFRKWWSMGKPGFWFPLQQKKMPNPKSGKICGRSGVCHQHPAAVCRKKSADGCGSPQKN
jgi:glycosyltransferase involved in cell wall biosynthesis